MRIKFLIFFKIVFVPKRRFSEDVGVVCAAHGRAGWMPDKLAVPVAVFSARAHGARISLSDLAWSTMAAQPLKLLPA